MRRRILALLVVLGVVHAGVGRARACSCASPRLTFPADGASQVALNTRLWIANQGWGEGPNQPVFTLAGPQGAVPVTLGRMHVAGWGGFEILVATPTAALQPGVEYTFRSSHQPLPLMRFQTGAARDDVLPPLPAELSRVAKAGWSPFDDCRPDYQILQTDVSWEGELLLANVTPGTAVPPPPDLGRATLAFGEPPYAAVAPERKLSLGISGCSPWPELTSSGHLWYGVLDGAGNFSGWTDAGDVVLPALPDRDAAADAGGEADAGPSVDVAPPDAASPDGASNSTPTSPADAGGCSCSSGAAGTRPVGALSGLLILAACELWHNRRRCAMRSRKSR
jgi:hypothetical protein